MSKRKKRKGTETPRRPTNGKSATAPKSNQHLAEKQVSRALATVTALMALVTIIAYTKEWRWANEALGLCFALSLITLVSVGQTKSWPWQKPRRLHLDKV